MSTISVSTARQTLPEQLDRVEAGDEVSITRHGRVVAVLIRPDVLKTRRGSRAWAEADRIGKLLEAARDGNTPRAAIAPDRAEELIDALQDNRSIR